MRRFVPFAVLPILALVGGLIGPVSLARGQTVPAPAAGVGASNYQGLWWKAPAGSESGWGINFSHQGDIIFATWFTYDAQRQPWWLIAELHATAAGVYSGPVSTVTGPPFNADPFPPEGSPGGAIESQVGTMTATFSDASHGTVAYTVNGVLQAKAIVPQQFGPPPICTWGAQPDLALATNYTDLWWRAPAGSESGWGINFSHQGDIIFATWFTYDAQRQPWWLIAELHATAAGVYSGPVSTVTGPPFDADPFPPEGSPGGAIETTVGTATATFADGNAATFAYTVNGVAQTKPITRQVFRPPGTVCSNPLRVPTALTVASPTASPWVGETVQLTAAVRDQFGYVMEGATPTWSSSDPEVATVSANGALQGQGTGPVEMMASVSGVWGSVSLAVAAVPRISVTVGTTKEVIFAYSKDRCDDGDTPDSPVRLVRAEEGGLVLINSNAPRNYFSRGTDFDSLKRDCRQPALTSADRRTAESYENWEWLWAVYREGNRWHALIHNEFHDAVASTCDPGNPAPGNPCWYNSITYAVSTDGARSFSKPSPPAHVVAPAPKPWVPPLAGMRPDGEGYMSPTHPVRAGDGYYYVLMELYPDYLKPGGGLCVMRTGNLDDPARWRAWDGSGFNLHMTSPYLAGKPALPCEYLDTELGVGYVVYNTYVARYVHVVRSSHWIDGRLVCGIFYALSADLIHWGKPQLIAEGILSDWGGCENPQGPGVLEPVGVGYPSIVDHDDTTTNFERSGRTGHLYYVRFNQGAYDRDLVRVPLTFTWRD